MRLFSLIRDCLTRALERRRTLAVFLILWLAGAVLGGCFVTTPATYGYHLALCERFVDRVCYSDQNVFLIFTERTAGCALLLALVLLSGVHVAALVAPPVALLYRAYTFGGSLCIFFSVYRVSGALIVFALYLPVHLLVDGVLVLAAALSCARAPRFCFSRRDFGEIGLDFLALGVLMLLVCLLEAVLLLTIFHPLGNLM